MNGRSYLHECKIFEGIYKIPGELSIDYLMTPDLLSFLSTSFVRDDNFIKMPEFQLSCLNEFFKKFIVVLF